MGTPRRGPNLPCFRFERELTSAESWGRSLTRESSRTEVVQVKRAWHVREIHTHSILVWSIKRADF